ncbi:Laccase-2 [Tetrabaena socialis]|uniref:Laccase-2 n=1 Tax=Tetrabaena socialis TaxID=47790 RepID=A0A2J7ZU22_9CHLO|nr:Laccase-2 [Tetrabaena socialis]|eukprot:PNH03773.1 Laccase-2 [Tetrabaena socialis]
MKAPGAHRRLALAVLSVLSFANAQPAPPGSALAPDSVVEKNGGVVVSYTLNVTLAWGAPSCFSRPIILISGVFQPAIEINQGDTLKVTLVNNVPASYPMVSDGISVHFHGLRMHGAAAWYDGVSYIALCPIIPSASYTYQSKARVAQ